MFKVSDAFDANYLKKEHDSLWEGVSCAFQIDEDCYIQQLIDSEKACKDKLNEIEIITERSTKLIESIRTDRNASSMIDSLMQQYSLNTDEGVLLMCLAEALIRVPDKETGSSFIRDRLTRADWSKHLKKSDSLFVNASTWGLLISGKVLNHLQKNNSGAIWNRLTGRLSEPVIRTVIEQAMKVLGNHFVLGQTINSALNNGGSYRQKGYTYSFDMLGEAALTMDDALQYKKSYCEAIKTIGNSNKHLKNVEPASISIKLSALHPRYEKAHEQRVMDELGKTINELILMGKKYNVGITIDAEEVDRLEISLKLFEQAYTNADCAGWGMFGLVVQAYSNRALVVLTWLRALAKKHEDKIPVRLVKGAYWDSEIKHAQQLGEKSYPVFTRKESTDLSYLVCARFLLKNDTNCYIYPQFASHNPQTVASVLEMASGTSNFELQRLHGMGDALYDQLIEKEHICVRIYAPVGNHKDLLPYLVRRLLENGANTSFVHRLADANAPVSELVRHPLQIIESKNTLHNPRIALPEHIFSDRKNSSGINIAIENQWQLLFNGVRQNMKSSWTFGPMINGHNHTIGKAHQVVNPANNEDSPGTTFWADNNQVEAALSIAHTGFAGWNKTPVEKRAEVLNNLANLLESNRNELIALCQCEAGKTVKDSIDEIREAVDFCRYYALQAIKLLSKPQIMQGPTGEINELSMQGRGVFLCISPWNFPLAIFLGQITAALATGNTVLAKPAEQTSLIAGRAVELAWEAGIPCDTLQLLTGSGATIGKQLLSDERLAGVCFTGSTDTAMIINRQLAERNGSIIPFIAETGGQNAMIVDSTALPEQIVQDAVLSAFASAGQRCSALRVMYVQEDIASRVINILKGAMLELVIGKPSDRATDVGPVIDKEAVTALQAHIDLMEKEAELIMRTPITKAYDKGFYIAPVAFKIKTISQLTKENFGPVLHVITFPADKLDMVIDDINATGFGLTLGIHSRNETVFEYIADRINAGNIYVNRNQIGAVVGVQPFGGMGLSGTGPKAGGPHYLYRFVVEKHRSINTTAIGGNATLMAQSSGEMIR